MPRLRPILRRAALALSLCLLPLASSCTSTSTVRREDPRPPNFLVLLADDLGTMDLGFLGGPIRTPALDALAADGLVLTQFLVAPTCSPTRAMLMTGMDAHPAGLGTMRGCALDAQVGAPGYAGAMTRELPTLASVLRDAGYHTSLSGKWHLGSGEGERPHERGFERSFGIHGGVAGHFADAQSFRPSAEVPYYLDGDPVELPADFFSTTAYTDRLIECIDEALDQGRPFFAYGAYTAPHWPIQAPEAWLDRYVGAFDDGYDALRERNLAAAVEQGLVPAGATAPPRNPFAPAWHELSDEERAASARTMEVYAAMVEHLDAEIGRVLAHLRDRGVLDDTVVVVFPDNGPEGNPIDRIGDAGAELAEVYDNRVENIGRPGSYAWTGPGWAQASVAPLRLFKAFPTEGGVRVPAIVHGPIARRGMSDAIVSVADVAPTLIELAGVDVPRTMSGRSLRPLLDGGAEGVRTDEETIGYELFGRRSVRQGHWKATWIWPPYGPGAWELFDLAADPGEQHDLAGEEPERLQSLLAAWEVYAQENGVVLPESDGAYAVEGGR